MIASIDLCISRAQLALECARNTPLEKNCSVHYAVAKAELLAAFLRIDEAIKLEDRFATATAEVSK